MSPRATDPDVHVAIAGVVKRFGGVEALRGVDLTIVRGSIHALVGENGAGKSTLGKVAAGVHKPDAGHVRVDGRLTNYHSPRDALADGVTMIAQELTLVPHRSVIENVFLGASPSRCGFIDARALRRRYAELDERAGFGLPPDPSVRTLRVAEQQKVEILRALARDARLIIMDEPTAALTSEEARKLFAVIRWLRTCGTTVVYVSHFLDDVLSLADTVTVLRDGNVVQTTPGVSETPTSLVRAMLGKPMELAFPAKHFPPKGAAVALHVKGLSAPPVIIDVDLEVRRGEILGLAGLVGSGRTEVARAVFGADRNVHGHIKVNGKEVRIRHPRDAIRVGIAMLPESRKQEGLLLHRSITANVILPHLGEVATAGFVRRRAARNETSALIGRIDVRTPSAETPVGRLSGGNQQKVLFAKWLFRRPHVLLADEPTRGVDIGAKRAIYELIQSLADEGMGVLLISSEVEEVLGLAHRILVMRAGRVVAELDGRDASEDAVMLAAFGTQTDEEEEKEE